MGIMGKKVNWVLDADIQRLALREVVWVLFDGRCSVFL
jgi:hypothetical protein